MDVILEKFIRFVTMYTVDISNRRTVSAMLAVVSNQNALSMVCVYSSCNCINMFTTWMTLAFLLTRIVYRKTYQSP
jgi:hypothetical protein